jgi:soluble lytic murein transglycosylase-like protein
MRTSPKANIRLSDISVICGIFALAAAAAAQTPPRPAAVPPVAPPAARKVAAPAAAPVTPAAAPAAPAAAGKTPAKGAPSAAEAQAAAVRQMMDAVARQRAAIEKQRSVSSSEFFTVPFSGPPMIPPPAAADIADCGPTPEKDLLPLITATATAQQLQPELLLAVIRQESGFRSCAVSAKGAMGLMQLMPETAGRFQVADPYDPVENVKAGARYLKQLLDRFTDVKLALAAYNAGPGSITGDSVPNIPETQTYVQNILTELEKSKP